jgi:hypothetical protein
MTGNTETVLESLEFTITLICTRRDCVPITRGSEKAGHIVKAMLRRSTLVNAAHVQLLRDGDLYQDRSTQWRR